MIVDSQLRTPPKARVLNNGNSEPVIFTTESASASKAERLADAGFQVVRVASNNRGHVSLSDVFRCSVERGVRSIMIEGGAKIITSVLLGRFADQLVLTLAPLIFGGVHAVEHMHDTPPSLRPKLKNLSIETLAGNIILHGKFEETDS
jgi:riboflavin biosynthesis pyrimidine reductase